MERVKKTLWPRDEMSISPEALLRLYIGMPTRFIKSLYPILGEEKVLELLRTQAEEHVLAMGSSPYYDGMRVESLTDFLEKSQGIRAPILTGPVHWNSVLVSKTTEIDMTSFKLEENKICFNITKCLWADLFKEMDAAEIGKAWSCESDYARAKVWNPKLELTRTQTIMEGAPCCDFCFTWKE